MLPSRDAEPVTVKLKADHATLGKNGDEVSLNARTAARLLRREQAEIVASKPGERAETRTAKKAAKKSTAKKSKKKTKKR